MGKNQAIIIGINHYRFLQPLHYAKQDAEALRNFLLGIGFDRIFLFSDDSPPINGKPTEPFRANILRVLRQVFDVPFMSDGDNFWFFFSGHGIRENNRDYLMPLDGDPEAVEQTGISTHTIADRLRRCGADNIVMILDACRSQSKKAGEGIGRQTETEARQMGLITIFSCSPEQYSYEISAIGQGAFTCALLEGLGDRGRCATVEQLNQYLEHRVPELVQLHLGNVRQRPYTIAEPISKSHLILIPEHAVLANIATLKNHAYRAERANDWALARQLWRRILITVSGQDEEAIEAIERIGQMRRPLSPPASSLSVSSDLSTQLPGSPGQPRQVAIKRPLLGWVLGWVMSAAGVVALGLWGARALWGEHLHRSIPPVSQAVSQVTPSRVPSPVATQVAPSSESSTPPASRVSRSSSPSTAPPAPLSVSPTPRPPAAAPTVSPGLNQDLNTIVDQEVSSLTREILADYSKLNGFLQAGQWQDADQETLRLMLKIADRQQAGYLDIKDIQAFPCDSLRRIDQLWVKSSDGKFGFSVQKKIWQEAGSPTNYPAWMQFDSRVGWLANDGHAIDYSAVQFTVSAPQGHLPTWGGQYFFYDDWIEQIGLRYFLPRVAACQL